LVGLSSPRSEVLAKQQHGAQRVDSLPLQSSGIFSPTFGTVKEKRTLVVWLNVQLSLH